jgi:tRNA-dihydrouridine synthase
MQMYTGNVDLDSFGILASACKREVTYNGDIFTQDDFKNIRSRFPAIQSFMLGRGALSDPFLPSAIKGQSILPDHKAEKLRQFHDEIFNYYKSTLSGDKHLLDKMKEFWSYLSVHTDRDGKLMKKIKKCHTASAYLDIVNPILDSSAAWGNI